MTDSAAKADSRRSDAAHGPGPLALFFKGFVKHPVMVGSIIPSSKKLIEKMLAKCDWPNTKLFVEYGPGVGTFCQTVLDKLPDDATYVAIDTNPDFIDYLKRTIPDPRFHAVLGSAADVEQIVKDHGHDKADYVLSGLPFSTLPPGVGDAIGQATGRVVRPGGAFLVYQFSPKCRDFIEPNFDRLERDREWWNIPPAVLFWGWRE
ncbi:class I SAM-dependent methyltransferase [uncultured Parasphingopyxis sp.]|uniref:class I SAM-dependent methyltransferase n=1 Tax=uncultured Parasphingopyxis sp. TaxID=1547918 RepID=UPI002608EC02|nr:methyltransferase domain-containing protein [uncultured Parasphingopyxis sp.]